MAISRPIFAPLIDFRLPDPPQVWLVIYMDPPEAAQHAPPANRLLSRLLRLLRPGFQHVMAVSPVGRAQWLVCNPGSCNLALGLAPSADVLVPIRQAVARGTFHCQTVIAERPEGWQLRPLFTCANVIAHLIGIRGKLLMTPHDLYQRIAAMQAEQATQDAETL